MNHSFVKHYSVFYPVNNPRWPENDKTWIVGFYIHVYCYGAVFLILLAYCIRIFVYSIQRYHKSKIARIGGYCLAPLIISCVVRILFLFIDPYGFYNSVPLLASRLLYCSMSPFLSLGFYIEQRLLLRFSSLVLKKAKTNYKVFVVFIHIVLLTLAIVTEVVIHSHNEMRFLLLLPKGVFVILVIAFCLKFLYLAFKLTHYVEQVHSIAKDMRHASKIINQDRNRKSRKQKCSRSTLKNEEVELLENTSASNSCTCSSSDESNHNFADSKHENDTKLHEQRTTKLNSPHSHKHKRADIHTLISHYRKRLFSRREKDQYLSGCSKTSRLHSDNHNGNCSDKPSCRSFYALSGFDNHVLTFENIAFPFNQINSDSCNGCNVPIPVSPRSCETKLILGEAQTSNDASLANPSNQTEQGKIPYYNESASCKRMLDLEGKQTPVVIQSVSNALDGSLDLYPPESCDSSSREQKENVFPSRLSVLPDEYSVDDNKPIGEYEPLLHTNNETDEHLVMHSEKTIRSETKYTNKGYDNCVNEISNSKLVAFRNALYKQEELEIEKILELFHEFECDNGYLGDNETSLQNEPSSCQLGCDCGNNESENISNPPLLTPTITDQRIPNLTLYEFRRAETLETALQRLYLCVFLFIILCVFESFEVLGPYGIFSRDNHPASWPWLIFHYLYRTSELLIVYVLSSAADVLICRKTTRKLKKIFRK